MSGLQRDWHGRFAPVAERVSRVPMKEDPDLGTVRWCARCEDWWPIDDPLFYYVERRVGGKVAYHCVWCNADNQRRYRERARVERVA